MIEAFIIEVCATDGLPLEESKFYQTLKNFFGEEWCSFLVKESRIDLVHPPPKVMQRDSMAG